MKRLFILILALLTALMMASCKKAEEPAEPEADTDSGYRRTTLYYATEDGFIVPVMKSIPWEEGIGRAALSYLVSGIDNDKSAAMMGLKTVIPEGTECTLRIGEGGSARVDLTDIGQQTEEQEQAMVVAIVNTLTEFPSINNVSITIDGKEKKTLSNGTDISKPMESFALNIEDGEVPVSGEAHAFTLYFPNSAASLNIPVTRYTDTAHSFSGAVQEEIAGPKDEGLINCFPAGTELISAYIKNGIACVDLTKDFEKVADTEGMLDAARDCLYLCANQFDQVYGVDITVEGKEYSMHTSAVSVPVYVNEWR